ncbi:MAG: hypothetical protein K2G19_08430, partial [Lachnospiraceae bacterium]|nr:hypothetical protein [Lachnospiraceae bacterium]
HDGWCYFDAHKREEENWVCRVAAVSIEGEQQEIISLKSDGEAEENYGYTERICQMEISGDRIYIVFGGYAGSGGFYQGGRIITTKLDGTDYRAIESYEDAYYVCHDAGRTLVYLPQSYMTDEEEYGTRVWDMEADTLFLSDFPQQFIYQQQGWGLLPYQRGCASNPLCILTGEETNVYALPFDSGTIVPVAINIDDKIIPYDSGESVLVDYNHLYYADGFLYFEVEYNVYDGDYAIGWRDGYRRLQTDVYRLKLDRDTVELLYSY